MGSGKSRICFSAIVLIGLCFLYEWNRDKEFDSYDKWQIGSYKLSEIVESGRIISFGNRFLLNVTDSFVSVKSIDTGKEIFGSPGDGRSFISCAVGKESVDDWSSFFLIADSIQAQCSQVEITEIGGQDQASAIINGVFQDCPGTSFSLEFAEDPEHKSMVVMNGKCFSGEKSINRLMVQGRMHKEEMPFGFGIQFSKMHMKGQILSTFVREHGVTRGLQPWSLLINLSFRYSGMAGQFYWSYCPSPVFTTSKIFRSFAVLSYDYTVFDFRDEEMVRIAIWNSELKLAIGQSETMKDALTALTTKTGRMPALPKWLDNGVILGVQGGTEKIRGIVEKVLDLGVPLSGLWIQDWSGKVETGEALRVLWNWKRSPEMYENWHMLQEELQAHDIKFLNYVNPYCAEIQKKTDGSNGNDLSLCESAAEKGFLLLDEKKEILSQKSLSLSFKTIDFLQKKAREWYTNWILEYVIREPNSKGFMADFGENLPIVEQVAKYNSLEHNKFPVLWAQVVREAIDMAESVEGSDKILSFSRAGYRESPKYSKNFWVGDQLQTWDGYSGMKSALMGMLTGSVSGFTLIHGDIGGYVTLPVPGVKRTEEMLVRWIQLMAFSSCMRTHEGTLPQNVVQAYSNEDLLKTLKKYGEVFVALSETRRKIVEEATNFGIPLMRPMYLEFSESKDIYKVEEQFMYGDKIMVTPVLVEDAYSIQVYFPKIDPERRNNSPDIWVNLVSGEEFTSCDCFQEVNVTIADIPVFVPKGQANEFDFLKILYRPMM